MISVAVTAYNESSRGDGEWILSCLKSAAATDMVDEVVVVDDCSNDWPWLEVLLKDKPKVKLFHNDYNLGVFGNKLRSIELCSHDWVQICDSDDTMDASHFERLDTLHPTANTIYCNSFGRSSFDYRKFCGSYSAEGYTKLAGDPYFSCLFNTGNHFLHRSTFLDVVVNDDPFRSQIQLKHPGLDYARLVHDGADSAFYNSRWLLAGNLMEIVSGLEYMHRYNNDATSAYARAPADTKLLPPLYFYELCRDVDPSLPAAGQAGTKTRHGRQWATYQTNEGHVAMCLSTLEVQR